MLLIFFFFEILEKRNQYLQKLFFSFAFRFKQVFYRRYSSEKSNDGGLFASVEDEVDGEMNEIGCGKKSA
jgi:hypothetical protein